MARSTRLVILIKNIYTLWGRKRFLLPVTYFPTNLVYPFTLRVTGIKILTVDDPKQILKKLLTGQNDVKFLSYQKPTGLLLLHYALAIHLNQFNVDEVSSLFLDPNICKHQYLLIRSFVNSKTSFNLLPSYEKLLEAETSSFIHVKYLPNL